PFAGPAGGGRPAAADPLDPLARPADTGRRGGGDPLDPLAPRTGRPNGHDPLAPRGAPGRGADGAAPAPGPAHRPADGPPEGSRRPGAGDEQRSLFGEVAGEQGGSRPAEPGGRGAPALRDDVDPLGPPQPRPPIDLSRLDTPLGPPPPLPARTDAGAATEAPRRLPRRHEVDDGATAAAPAPPGRRAAGRRRGRRTVRAPPGRDPAGAARARPRPPGLDRRDRSPPVGRTPGAAPHRAHRRRRGPARRRRVAGRHR